MSIKSIVIFALSVLGVLSAKATVHTLESIPNVQLSDSTAFVSNPDNILSPEAVAEINGILNDIRRQTTSEVAIAIVDDVDTDDIDQFATELFEKWAPGKKGYDNGLLVLIVKDKRFMVMRTGYGTEAVMTSAMTGRIRRDIMNPYFAKGDYDTGTLKGAKEIHLILTDPKNAEKIQSQGSKEEEDWRDFLTFLIYYLGISIVITIFLIIYLAHVTKKNKEKDTIAQYKTLDGLKATYLAISVLGIAIPLVAYSLLKKEINNVRNKPRKCPNCGTEMHKLDEETDNQYLTPSQDAEEHLDSVDYDVWLCPECNETDIIPFVNKDSRFTECPRCGARAAVMTKDRIVMQPTQHREGKGVKSYTCRHCNNIYDKVYNIPKVPGGGGVYFGGGGGGFRGGGGFGGGSFGGGLTGGGGSSGGW